MTTIPTTQAKLEARYLAPRRHRPLLQWLGRTALTIGAPMRATGDLDADLAMLRHAYRREMARNPAAFWDAAS